MGVHPKHILELHPWRFRQLKSFMSMPRVSALGEIGLDYTVQDVKWGEQKEGFIRVVSEVMVPEKPVILHLRDHGGYGSDVSHEARLIFGQYSSPHQKIHLHCFTGTPYDVQQWHDQYPNAYFGLTALVFRFDEAQFRAVKAITENRLLLETDSPYLPVGKNCVNTPAYIGDIARRVASLRGNTST